MSVPPATATARRLVGLRGTVPQAFVEAAPVVVGLGVLGLSGYAFLIAAARGLGPVDFAPVSVAWTLVFTVATGLLAPFEQESGRLVAGRRARGQGTRPVAVTAATAAALLCV